MRMLPGDASAAGGREAFWPSRRIMAFDELCLRVA
jgi:hypothetical protein